MLSSGLMGGEDGFESAIGGYGGGLGSSTFSDK